MKLSTVNVEEFEMIHEHISMDKDGDYTFLSTTKTVTFHSGIFWSYLASFWNDANLLFIRN